MVKAAAEAGRILASEMQQKQKEMKDRSDQKA